MQTVFVIIETDKLPIPFSRVFLFDGQMVKIFKIFDTKYLYHILSRDCQIINCMMVLLDNQYSRLIQKKLRPEN